MTQQKALSKVFGDPQKKILKRLEKRVAIINGLSEKYEKLSDKELQDRSAEKASDEKECNAGYDLARCLCSGAGGSQTRHR